MYDELFSQYTVKKIVRDFTKKKGDQLAATKELGKITKKKNGF